jgi:hypothetical protein
MKARIRGSSPNWVPKDKNFYSSVCLFLICRISDSQGGEYKDHQGDDDGDSKHL